MSLSLGNKLSLVDVLCERAEQSPLAPLFSYMEDGQTETSRLSRGGLHDRARAIAAVLQSFRLEGERALLFFPDGLDYATAFFGCLYARIIAVPTFAIHPSRLARSLSRLRVIARDARPAVILTTTAIASQMEQLVQEEAGADFGDVRWIAIDEIPDSMSTGWSRPAIATESLAYLQYTSGSTGNPKGVMISHANVLDNLRNMHEAFGHDEPSTLVVWLPTFHDMGLVYGLIQPIFSGFANHLMPPTAFLKRPMSWLEVMTRVKATHTVAPNFGYERCLQKVNAEEVATLDLSACVAAMNGAEPIRLSTIDRFSAAFESVGFLRSSFRPCYGLAEATLMVTAARAASVRAVILDSEALGRDEFVVVPAQTPSAQTLVSCGPTYSDTELVITDPQSGLPCAPRRVGEVWVRGSSVAQGYWGHPGRSNETFGASAVTGAAPFMRTGDLGIVHDGELYVTGRLKDVIIIRGRNHYPQDIESIVEASHESIRPGCVAAFGVDVDGEERLVVVAEVERRHRITRRVEGTGQYTERRRSERRQEVLPDAENVDRAFSEKEATESIRRAVSAEQGLQVHSVVFLTPGSLPKTTSGKLQRRACLAAYLSGSLVVP